MTKLYNSREINLIDPLDAGEGGYVFESKYINKIIEKINKRRYGSYLIGGMVGVGKSSVASLATSLAKGESILVHLKFYNEQECIDEFLRILLEKLIEVLKRDGYDRNISGLEKVIEEIEKYLSFDITEQKISEKINVQVNEASGEEKVSSSTGLGILFDKIIQGKAKVDVDISLNEKENVQDSIQAKSVITMTKKQEDMYQYVNKILETITSKNVVIVYDELDKLSGDVLKELFSRYKKLFVEYKAFHFFLVNELIYSRYSENNLIVNPFITCFMQTYYIPMLSFCDTLRYIRMMFGEKYYLEGLVTYYVSLGNYRLINARYLSATRRTEMEVIKAYIHKRVSAKMLQPYLNEYERDMLVVSIKCAIEKIFNKNEFNVAELSVELEKELIVLIDKNLSYSKIIHNVISIIEECASEAICRKGDIIAMNLEELWNQRWNISKLAEADRREALEEEEKKSIQICDMYEYINNKDTCHLHGITYLREDIIPVQVADNRPEAYEDALMNILLANLDANSAQVIVLKRARGAESFYENDYAYTGIVAIDKGEFQVAYYVNEGCYESEKYIVLEKFVEEAQRLGLKVPIKNTDERVDLKKGVKDIVAWYNKI